MSAQENKTLVRREQQELWNHTDELHAAQVHFAADQAEAAKHQAAHFRRGFPDVLSTHARLYAFSRMLMSPSRLSCTVKGNAVVAIGVDRGRAGRDNSPR